MISNIVVNAALLTPYEPLTISFKYKNDLGRKITKMVLRAIVKRSSFSGETGSDLEIPLHSFLGTSAIDGETVNLAAGKSKTFTATFDIPGTVEFYFSEYPNARAVPVHVNGTASFSDGTAIGIDYEISDLKILNHRFTPQITEMNLVRAANGLPNDEGENVLTTLNFSVNNTEGYDYTKFFTARMYQSQGDEATETDEYIDLTSSITALLSGVTNDADILPGTYDKAYDWDFLLAFGDEYEMFYGRFNLGRAFANMHLSGQITGGVCFGGFSTSTYGNPKTESYYPIYAYGGIEGVTNYAEDEVDTGGKWVDYKPIYRKVIHFDAIAAGGTKAQAIGIDVPETIVSLHVIGKTASGGDWIPIPYASSGGSYQIVARLINISTDPTLQLKVLASADALSGGYAIIAYTKLADEPVYPNDFSAALLDANGATVADASGAEVAVRSASGDVYQSQYTGTQIDAGITAANNALPKSGGTLTGPLSLISAPTDAAHAANKDYVDQQISQIELTPGPAGPQGPQGETGPAGPAGADGEAGANGKSAYEYAVAGGFTGTEEEFALLLGKVGSGELDSVAWDNITGKPFGNLITGSAVPDGNTLTWDGDTDKGSIQVGSWYLVSENVPTMADLAGGYEYAIAAAGTTDELWNSTANTAAPAPTENEYGIYFGDFDGQYIRIVNEPCTIGSLVYPYAGVYFNGAFAYTRRLTISGYTFTGSTEIAPIPEKYIPGSIARQSAVDAMLSTTSGAFEWNGAIGDREVATNLDGALDGDTYVRVSETFIYPDELYTGGCTVYLNGNPTAYTEEEANAVITDYTESANVKVFWFQPGVYSVMYTDGGATIPNLRSFPKPGVYFRMSTDGSYVSKLESSGISKLMTDTRLNTDLLPTLSSFIMETAGGKKFRITIDANGNFVPTEL